MPKKIKDFNREMYTYIKNKKDSQMMIEFFNYQSLKFLPMGKSIYWIQLRYQ